MKRFLVLIVSFVLFNQFNILGAEEFEGNKKYDLDLPADNYEISTDILGVYLKFDYSYPKGNYDTSYFSELSNIIKGVEFVNPEPTLDTYNEKYRALLHITFENLNREDILEIANKLQQREDVSQVLIYETGNYSLILNFNQTNNQYGDINLDGEITASDSAKVMQYILNKDATNLNPMQLEACNIFGDSEITSKNAASILSKVLNKDFNFPMKNSYIPESTQLYINFGMLLMSNLK